MTEEKESDNDTDRKAFLTNTIMLALVVAAMLYLADGMVQGGTVPAAAIPGIIVLMMSRMILWKQIRITIPP